MSIPERKPHTEVADALGVDTSVITAMCRNHWSKTGIATKIGKTWFIDTSRVFGGAATDFAYQQQIEHPSTSIQWFDDRYYRLFVEETGEEDYLESVTTILNVAPKPWLLEYYGTVGYAEARRRMADAADRGSRIHHGCATYAQGGFVYLDNRHLNRYSPAELEDLYNAFEGRIWQMRTQEEYIQVMRFVEFLRLLQPRIWLTEATVYSVEHHYAGTLDFLLEIPQGGMYQIAGSKPIEVQAGFYIVDLKTGNAVDDAMRLQLSAYFKAIEEGTQFKDLIGAETAPKLMGGMIFHSNSPRTKNGIEGATTKIYYRDELEDGFRSFQDIHRVWKYANPHAKPVLRQMPEYLTTRPELLKSFTGEKK